MMLDALIASLNHWNSNKTERQKLQHALLLLSACLIVIAGITSLIDAKIGHDIVLVAVFGLAVFMANAIVWNLMQSSILSKLSSRQKRK